ncbi:MAG: hypothetical protein MJ238_05320 [Bacilli bacterium]|nr:hypothetical protein [Bacilli bacterium]
MKLHVLILAISSIVLAGCSSIEQSSLSAPISSLANPIENSFKSIADSIYYDFDPTTVISKEYRVADGGSFRPMNYDEVVDFAKNAPEAGDTYLDENGNILNIFMKFDGYFRDGYSGKVVIYEAHLTLWENGVFTAKVTDEETTRRGVWYNELSLDSTRGLKLVYPKLKTVVSGSSQTLSEVICSIPDNSTYDFEGRLPFETKNKEDEIQINGYYYSPEVGFYLDDHGITNFKLARLERDIANAWDPYLVLKNLRTLLLDDKSYEVVKYEIDDIETPGTKTVRVKYKNYSFDKTITVEE